MEEEEEREKEEKEEKSAVLLPAVHICSCILSHLWYMNKDQDVFFFYERSLNAVSLGATNTKTCN